MTQAGNSSQGQQHIPRFIQQPRSKEIPIQPHPRHQRQRNNPLQPNRLKDLPGESVSKESVVEERIEGSTESHGETTGEGLGWSGGGVAEGVLAEGRTGGGRGHGGRGLVYVR